MKRLAALIYGVVCYGLFFAVFLYSMAFIGDFWATRTIDSPASNSTATAVVINLLLFGMFGLQHSVMARPTFKRWWMRVVPQSIERSTYVLFATVAWGMLMYFWQPIPGSVWTVQVLALRVAMYTLFALGWITVLASTLLINHFELFGLRQVWNYYRGVEEKMLRFQTPALYKFVRHPLYVGWITVAWATPTMTVGHMLFASVATLYILIAIQLEERNLCEFHTEYPDYRQRVPMLVPGLAWLRRQMGTNSRRAPDGSALTHV